MNEEENMPISIKNVNYLLYKSKFFPFPFPLFTLFRTFAPAFATIVNCKLSNPKLSNCKLSNCQMPWSLRLSVRTRDFHSLKRSSTLLGTTNKGICHLRSDALPARTVGSGGRGRKFAQGSRNSVRPIGFQELIIN